MAIAYNSLLNKDWYSRMLDRIKTGISGSIRATGSEANDPYWKAREAQGIADLNAARMAEFRRLQDRGMAARAASQDREKARQRVISGALARDVQPAQYLGGPGYEAQELQEPGAFGSANGFTPQLPTPGQAYAAPYSGALKSQVPALPTHRTKGPALSFGIEPSYNPSKFANYDLDRRRKELEEYYAKLVNKPGKVAVY